MPHTTPDLAELGRRAGMLRRDGDCWRADDFAHELSLVFKLEGGRLAVFNSCSHAGLPVIVAEVAAAFPDWHIAAYVGGLHLVHATSPEILAAAETVRSAGIDQLYTGHCTGSHACDILAAQMPSRIAQLHPGLVISI